MEEKYIIDRIEENYVIIEKDNGDIDKIIKYNIKGTFKEGDVLINIGNRYFEVDEEFTLKRKEQIDNIIKDMWKE